MTDDTEANSPPPCAGGRTHDPGQPVWCPACAGIIGDRLADLPALLGRLQGEVDGQAGTTIGGDPVSGTPGRPSPSAAVDELDAITRLLEFWEDAHREYVGHTMRPARPYARRAAAAIRYLRGNLEALLAGPHAEEFGRDVQRAHARTRRLTATDTVRTRKPTPCPTCDLRALVHAAGDRYIGCDSCGRLLSFSEYDTWTRMVAADKTRRSA